MSKYHNLLVSDVRKETADSVVVELQIPNELRETFQFKPGQYLGVRADIGKNDVRRSYSICSDSSEENLCIGVKKVEGGLFSTFANNVLKAGDSLEVMPPLGKFIHETVADKRGFYVFFAAGSGITPIISLIKSILREEKSSHIILFYGNRTSEGIMFRKELEALKNVYMGRFTVQHILSGERQSSDLFNGRIDAEKCDAYGKTFFNAKEVDKFFICGPEDMTENVRTWLDGQSVEIERIKFELFTSPTGHASNSSVQAKKVLANPEKKSVVTVRIDGDAMSFNLAYGAENILDAAIKAGADAPFSCKGGVCCTCKAMLMDGEVDMDVVYGLEPDEIEDGYILTCQSHPRSDTVLVDYDV